MMKLLKKKEGKKFKFREYLIPATMVMLCIAVGILLTDKVMTVKAGDEVNMETFNNKIAELNTEIEDLKTKIVKLETDTNSNKESIEIINPKISIIEEKISEIDKKISTLTAKVNTISTKLDNVEEKDNRIVGTWIQTNVPSGQSKGSITFKSDGTCGVNCFYKNNVINFGIYSIGNYFLRNDDKLVVSHTVGGAAILTRTYTKQ